MEGFVHPLERNVYSWLVNNYTAIGVNASSYPFQLPTSTLSSEWMGGLNMEDLVFRFPFQDVSLGVLTLFILQKSVQNPSKISQPFSTLAGKCDMIIYNLVFVNILKTIIGIALLLLTVPIILPIVCVFCVTSFVTKLLYSFQFGPCVSKAEGMDGVWGVESKESRPFITICLLIPGFPDIAKIQAHLRRNILDVKDEQGEYKYMKFRQMFLKKYGYYAWKDVDDFNMENHIKVINLQEFFSQKDDVPNATIPVETTDSETVGRKEEEDELVYRFLSQEGTTALPSDRPPWEVLLLVRSDNRYNVVVRLHHAIGDGVTLVRLCVEALVDTPLLPPHVGSRQGNLLVRAALMVWSALVLPLGLLQVVANFDRNALHGQQLSGKKVMACSRGLPLNIVKQVKNAAHGTVNDVLMSCLAASLSKHFARRSEDVRKVTAVVPVSFHDVRAPLKLTNCFSAAAVKLPVAAHLSSYKRLTCTKKMLDGMKRDPALAAVYWVVSTVSEVLPAPVAELLLTGSGVTVAASNVPGPQQEISVWGEKVEDLHFWIPNRAPVGVGVSFASYMGSIKVGLNVDAALVKSREEAQTILDDVEQELSKLHKCLVRETHTTVLST